MKKIFTSEGCFRYAEVFLNQIRLSDGRCRMDVFVRKNQNMPESSILTRYRFLRIGASLYAVL